MSSARLAACRVSAAVWLAAAACDAGVSSLFAPKSGHYSVVSIVVLPDSVTIHPSDTVQFLAYGRSSRGDSVPVDVTWSAAGGSISPTGQFIAGPVLGTYVVRSRLEGGTLTGTANAWVTKQPPPVYLVEVSPETTELTPGATEKLVAVVRDSAGVPLADRPVEWRSTAEDVARVSLDGVVTGVAPGSARIIAASEGREGAADVIVKRAPVATVTVMPPGDTIFVTGRVQLTATASDAAGNPLTDRAFVWTSSDPSVARVNETGLVTGTGVGTATVVAASEGKKDSAAITVVERRVASVRVSPPRALLLVDQTLQFAATTRDSTGTVLSGRVVSWSSDNPSVATVNQSGLVTAASPGTAIITAESEGQHGDAAITVAPPGTGECARAQPAWIWCDDFEQDRLGSYFEYDSHGGGFTRVAGVGVDSSAGMRAQFATGQVEAGHLHLGIGRTPSEYMRTADAGTAVYRELYWRVYLRNQPGWIGGGGYKLSRSMILADANWAQAMIGHVWANELTLDLDPASGTDSSGTLMTTKYNDFPNLRWLGIARSLTPFFDATHVGRWYCIEARVRLNDAGQANGVFQLWIDGTLEAERTDLNWVGGYNEYGINAVYLENYWNLGSPRTQERYLDNFVVSTERIGC